MPGGRKEILEGYQGSLRNYIDIQERLNTSRRRRGEKPVDYPPYTPTQYMLEMSPGNNKVKYRGKVYETSYGEGIPKYNKNGEVDKRWNEKASSSAGRAFRKIRNNEPGSSGEKIYERGKLYETRQKGKVTLGRPKGLHMAGIWMVVVTYNWRDSGGVMHGPSVGSFILLDKHDRVQSKFDTAKVAGNLDAAVAKKMAEWTARGSDASLDYDVLNIQLVRIQTTNAGPSQWVMV